MSHDHTPPGPSPFPPEMVDAFRTDDKRAGAAIVLLMCGIFVIGLVLYLGVCWSIIS
jgi:hypothetical protein